MDAKLIEAVARAAFAKTNEFLIEERPERADWVVPWDQETESLRRHWLAFAEGALAAINASGTHWIAPVEITHAMQRAANPREGAHYIVGDPSVVWEALRTACLAKEEGALALATEAARPS